MNVMFSMILSLPWYEPRGTSLVQGVEIGRRILGLKAWEGVHLGSEGVRACK